MSVLRKTRKQKVSWPRRILLGVLSAGLLSSLPMASLAAEETKAAYPATEKPIVTVQGNAVIDEAGKPTGFYELALCVQTADIIRSNVTHALITREEYDELVKKDPSQAANYTITPDVGHSFRSVAATLTVNTDVLTPVNWDVEYPEYDKWLGTAYENFDTYDVKGIRGIDPAKSDQNTLWWDEVPDITHAVLGDGFFAVGLDTAKPDEINVATARVEGYDAAGRKAVITMAGGTQLGGLTYSKPTPVVVIRFAYDLKRFPNVLLSKGNEVFSVARTETEGKAGTTVLTYLSDDSQAAESTNNQSVWYEAYTKPGNEFTAFYYYLDGELEGFDGTQTVTIEGETSPVTVKLPRTAGKAVLAKDESQTEKYSYFHNLLKVESKTLNFNYVNQLTYRKPAGSTGVMVLYYDWDDKLIGTQVVSPKGDVRAQVNAYVEKNFIHPELRTSGIIASAGDSAALLGNSHYVNLVDSLERQYTYRGKYAYTVGGDDTAQGVKDGEEYPLTNKLDYAFYRGVNTVTEVKNADGKVEKYYSVGKASGTQEEIDKGYDGNLFPYVNGWAIVEDDTLTLDNWQVRKDALQIENVWTTFGVGELTKLEPHGVGNALPLGGDTTFPGWKDPEIETAPTEYQYKVSEEAGNGYLRFADFSDIQSNLKSGRDVLIVKAVYEPGPALLEGYSYRMVSEPYYNKLNYASASEGAAYSVELELERATQEVGPVQGVNRMRSPAIRQDTTADQRWITNEELGINHDIPNPSLSTSIAKTETTYTKVDVDNGDRITFTLVFSARQNKVDYLLKETYQNNFVLGSQRSDSNNDRTGTAFTVDNYNYYVEGESEAKENFAFYYDAMEYENREGSHGFVLYGTLNNLMQKTTEYNKSSQSTADTQDFNRYVSYRNLADTNLRGDAVGTVASSRNQTAMRTALRNAATEAETHKNAADAGDYWNAKLGCAELSYHQLQWYILDGVLYDRATADSKLLGWCHLHKACAASVSNKPKNWDELVAAASDPDTVDYIDELLPGEIEDMTHLRITAQGGQFSGVAAFKEKFVAAVQAGATSWDQIQDHILRGSMNAAYSQANYWWYDGSTSRTTPNSLAALIETTADALTPPPVPDGSQTALRTAKMSGAETAFNNNAAQPGDATDRAWLRMTENLVGSTDENGNPVKFASFEEFKTAFVAAVGATGSQDWYTLQFYILNGRSPSAAELDVAKLEYFWHNGGRRVTDLSSMLEAGQKYLDGDTASWDAFSYAALYNPDFSQMHLRKSFNGQIYTQQEFEDFKDAVLAYLQKEGANKTVTADTAATVWNQLQYFLLHRDVDFTDSGFIMALSRESQYYWWRGGAEGEVYNLNPGPGNSSVGTLMEAMYRYTVNGNKLALNKLTEEAIAAFRLIPSYDKTDTSKKTWSDLAKYTGDDGVAALRKAMEDLMAETGVAAGYKNVDWRQIQHYLLTNTYLALNDSNLPSDGKDDKDGYWWRNGDDNPNAVTGPVPSDIDRFLHFIDQHIAGTLTDNDLKAKVDEYYGYDKLNIYGGTVTAKKPYTDESGVASKQLTAIQKNTIKTRVVNMAKALKKMGVTRASDKVDWYVLQHYSFVNITATTTEAAFKTKEYCKTYYTNTLKGDWAPARADDPPVEVPDEEGGGLSALAYEELSLEEQIAQAEAELQALEELLEQLRAMQGAEDVSQSAALAEEPGPRSDREETPEIPLGEEALALIKPVWALFMPNLTYRMPYIIPGLTA